MTAPDARSGIAPGGVALAGAVTALALLARAAALGAQPLVPDDVAVADTARNFVVWGWPEPTMWNHPRLRDLLVFASMDALGDGAWGIKLWSVILGSLAAGATSLLVRVAGGTPLAAAIAGLLLALDPLHLDFSRQGINDVHLSFFTVASVAAVLQYGRCRRVAVLAGAGLLVGLGAASKWSAVVPAAAAALIVLSRALRDASRRDAALEIATFAACLVLLPLAVYVLTFWPWFSRGHDLAEWLRFQATMAQETATHTGYPGTKLPGFPGEVVGAWRWFVQPIWYVDYVPPGLQPEVPIAGVFVAGVANPLASLATLPAAAWAAWRWRRGDGGVGTLLALLLAAYLPFALVRRPIWTNSAVAVLPFAAALVGTAADALARRGRRSRAAVLAWLAAAAVLSAALWFPATGRTTALGDAVLRALVDEDALDRETHLPASPGHEK